MLRVEGDGADKDLAVEAEKGGAGPVALVDMDSPQGSTSHWWNARESESPMFVTDLRSSQETLRIIDTAPQVPQERTIHLADFVLIPVRPSPNDLRALGDTLAVVERLQKPFCFVINAVKSRTRIATNTLQVLAQYGKVAPVMLGDRIDFAEAMIHGLAVSEVDPSSRSAEEMAMLWTYVSEQLRKL